MKIFNKYERSIATCIEMKRLRYTAKEYLSDTRLSLSSSQSYFSKLVSELISIAM